MSEQPIPRSAVERAAINYSQSLETGDCDTYLEKANTFVSRWADLAYPIEEPTETPSELRLSDDDYNAFRYTFHLKTTDRGPLAGYKIAVKDNVAIAGVPMTCGSAAVEFIPDRTAVVLRRLLSAGATLVGTTNMDEFAYGSRGEFCAHGLVKHPTDEDRLPGGSSSGSAVAVATEMADMAIGSDSGGSIRIPASLSGVVGFKPTFGTVPCAGLVHLAPSIDHIGPLATTVEDAATLYSVMSGPAVEDLSSTGVSPVNVDRVGSGVDSMKIGLVEELLEASTEAVISHLRQVVEKLSTKGYTVETVSVPSIPESWTALECITAYEFTEYITKDGVTVGNGTWYDGPFHDQLLEARHSGKIGNLAGEMLVLGEAIHEATGRGHYVVAQQVRQSLRREVDDWFEEYDALLMPTTQLTAPKPGEIGGNGFPRTLANTSPFNLTGTPALSIPSGTVDGLPIGIQLVTPRHTDKRTLRLGADIESVLSADSLSGKED